ncbi:MAG TPA: Gfo/Idh/MocA family oxidoreductase [Candidatus Hydrogenedentes bacterium]|nr:Gfo/Idh/MocA family oxidoreductase [Candidatus Hydrogenedentota bacterium]HPG69256.1 Gfo/Idh/MocA family oxidoreductase [Candidatus Hydrogenedentota bacterium]
MSTILAGTSRKEHDMVNVGFVGGGRISDLHALGYKDNPDARLFAVCDAVAERAEARRAEWGAEKAYTDYRELLADPSIHAVEVLTPYDTHEGIVLDALAAGKHVACQKPMTTSLESADRIVAAAEAAGVVFKVTEIYTTYPPLVFTKKLIKDGVIGEPVGMRIKYIASAKGGWEVSATTYEQQMRIAATGLGFETFDHGHHEWATAWYLLGEVERVCAWIDTTNGVLDDPATVMWKHRGGKRYGTCDFLFAEDMTIPSKYYSNDEWFEITGSRGLILINRGTGELSDRPAVSVCTGATWQHYDDIPADWSEGFIGATRNFIAAIQGEEPPRLSGRDGREVLRFGLAVTRSASKRREVYLDELDSAFPALHAWRMRRRERGECIVGPQRRSGGKTAKYAPQARALTEQLVTRFDPEAAGGWTCVLGLHLTAEGGVSETRYGVYVQDGKLELREGMLPDNADLTLRIPAGVWAAILLGKKRMETALFQGKIKYEGRAEQGLRLKSALRL